MCKCSLAIADSGAVFLARDALEQYSAAGEYVQSFGKVPEYWGGVATDGTRRVFGSLSHHARVVVFDFVDARELDRIGSRAENDGGLRTPGGICYDKHTDQILVADGARGLVLVYASATGAVVRRI